eukprot:CAMPEP_0198249610 /NCGR_PEP_ID=MMETSP1447-20131203/1084_1 /TAXON_ID=420782 /ORGANISM="Chaetoceros dichaeta, Strain CCMP1751" /LENGTH=229 /DNA_ID=CAMNT_0043934289 /DNA_START=232 /DNA_END=921 /DNA_ORIENTATION=+
MATALYEKGIDGTPVSTCMRIHNCRTTQSIRLMASAPSTETEVDTDKAAEKKALYIVSYPHPALRAENEEITKEELESGAVSKYVKEMFALMYATSGVGLAAPQVGINKRFMVYNPSGDSKKWLDETVMINPKIVEFSDGTDLEKEGCLSLPEMTGEVQRSKWIKVEAMNMKGKKIKKKYKGWEARIFQHECDHLNGVLFPDRMTDELQKEVQPKMDEMIAEFGEGGAL